MDITHALWTSLTQFYVLQLPPEYIHLEILLKESSSGRDPIGHYSHSPKQSPCKAGQDHIPDVYNPEPIGI